MGAHNLTTTGNGTFGTVNATTYLNIPSSNNVAAFNATNYTGANATFTGNLIVTGPILCPQITPGNSTTTTIMATAGHYGVRRFWDNTGQYCYARIADTAAPVIEAASANWIVGNSATTTQMAINVTAGGNLTLYTGPTVNATANITSLFEGI